MGTPAWDMRGSPWGFPGSEPQLFWSRALHQNSGPHSQHSRSTDIPSVIQQTFVAVDTGDTALNKTDSVPAQALTFLGGMGMDTKQETMTQERPCPGGEGSALWGECGHTWRSLPGLAGSPAFPLVLSPGFSFEDSIKGLVIPSICNNFVATG